jgi:hypothetical protein
MWGRLAVGCRSILEDYAHGTQLFCVRISTFCGFGSSLHRSLNGRRAFFCHDVDQTGFVRRIGLRSSEGGDELGMGSGGVHSDLGGKARIFAAFHQPPRLPTQANVYKGMSFATASVSSSFRVLPAR